MNLLRRASFAIVAAFAALLSAADPSSAQTIVVASCAAAGTIYAAGQSGRPIIIDVTGTQCVTGGGGSGGGATVTATAAAPTYVEGSTSNPLSTDLAANLRVIAQGYPSGSTNVGKTGSGILCDTTASPSYSAAQLSWVTCALNGAMRGDQTSWAGTALGAPSNYGTSPGAVSVPGVNAFVTNTVGVISAGSAYETVAASQTGQTLGPTGATGDYLSHCVIYPTTTSPGVVTVFDNTSTTANNVITFPGGASSISNLVPIAIPVGAVSVNGPWKATTTTNLLLICYGRFT